MTFVTETPTQADMSHRALEHRDTDRHHQSALQVLGPTLFKCWCPNKYMLPPSATARDRGKAVFVLLRRRKRKACVAEWAQRSYRDERHTPICSIWGHTPLPSKGPCAAGRANPTSEASFYGAWEMAQSVKYLSPQVQRPEFAPAQTEGRRSDTCLQSRYWESEVGRL